MIKKTMKGLSPEEVVELVQDEVDVISGACRCTCLYYGNRVPLDAGTKRNAQDCRDFCENTMAAMSSRCI